MPCKYDSEDIPDRVNIAEEWNDHYKIPRQQNECRNQGRNRMTKGQVCSKWQRDKSERLENRSEQNDGGRFEFENNTNIENVLFKNQEFQNNKRLETIKWPENFQIPKLLINIQRKCSLTVSSFQILSDAFQEYHTDCCHAFRISPNDTATETLEQCAAITYAIIRLLFRIGYNPERIAVSGLDTLMMLAAKDALKLEDACFAWKTIASLIKDGDDPAIAQQINAILLKLNINFQKTTSLINLQQLTLSDVKSFTKVILTNEEQNQQFLNGPMAQSYMIFGTGNDCSMKHIEKFDDFRTFITSQKNSELLKALEKALIKENKSLEQNTAEVFSVQVNLKQEKYLFGHLIHHCNILSAATMLTTIYDTLKTERCTLRDATFLFPVAFTSEKEIINFKIQVSSETSTVTYGNHKCATFQFGEPCCGMHSGTSNGRESQHIYCGINTLSIGSVLSAKSVTGKEFYTQMEQYHYHYHAKFRCVRKLMMNENSGTVELASSGHPDVLIDGAMQAIVFIYIQQYRTKSTTLVPFHIRRMDIVSVPEQSIPTGKCNGTNNILAFVKAELQNGQLLGAFEFATDKIAVAAHSISFYPMMPDNIMKSLKKDEVQSSNPLKPKTDFRDNDAPAKPETEEPGENNELSQVTLNDTLTLQDRSFICIKSIACRLPKTVRDPAEFWDALKTGQIMASKIPCSRINGRDSLARGQYGHPVRCANFLASDISHFDAAFFGISRSEAEKIDPQQRILLECVYESMENAGLTSLRDTGFFIGFMSNEYPDIVESLDAISMLGSSASVVSGRLNYLFGSTGPAITLDTACSSSLVALQAAMHALHDGQCTTAIVAGVNLILTEQSIGQRANGNLLADDGLCRSFDALSSGYGRADGCVVLLLSTIDKAIERNDFAVSVVSTCIGHNGQSVSLTAPSGCAQEKLLRDCLSKIQGNQPVKYWETHGTGTIIGDAIELKALQANLQHCVISTVKTHFGHSEAAAGAAGLAKILLQFNYEYIPEHGSYQFLQNLRDGSLYLPVIGEEWTDTLAGISSFGIGGTNAMALLRSEKITLKLSKNEITTKWQTYICPISAKSKESLDMLVTSYQTMLQNTFQNTEDICSTAALHRNHMQFRAVILLHKNKIMQKWMNEEKCGKQEAVGLELFSNSYLYILKWLYSTFPKFRMNFKLHFPLMKNFVMQQISAKFQRIQSIVILTGFLGFITFLNDIGIEVKAIHAHDNLSLITALLISGKLKFIDLSNIVNSNLQIFTPKTSKMNNYIDNYTWYTLDTMKERKIFEYELMKMIATSYLRGDRINWEYLYSLPFHPITLPNYQFKRESYWITKNSTTIDHWLIGRLMKEEEGECIFINQISKRTNTEFMAFKYGGQIRFAFGMYCEAVIQTLQLTFLKNITKKTRYCSVKDLTMIKYIVKENDWIKTTIKKNADDEYHVQLTCESNVICEANITLNTYAVTMKALNVTQARDFIAKPNFYEILNDKGLSYEGIYQTITHASPDGKMLVAKCCYQIFLIVETIIQVACYCDTLKPFDIYEQKKFTIENLNFCTFLSESVIYIWIESGKIVLYSGNDHRMMITVNLHEKKANEKFGKMKCRKGKDGRKSDQLIKFSSTTYQEYTDKVLQAVGDIRKDDSPISNAQSSTSFIELGLDSLAITDLANRLNTNYFPGLQIGAVDLFNYPNIYLLTNAIYNGKISSRIIDSNGGMVGKMTGEHSDIITASDKCMPKESRSQDKHSLSVMDGDESCLYAQIFLKQQPRNDCMTVIITDKKLISGRKSANELTVIVSSKTRCRSIQDDASTLYFNMRNPENFKRNFSLHLSGHKTVLIRFELSSSFPLQCLAEVLLHLTKVIIQCKHTYLFLSKPGCGSANAFALGFAKSLCAELYPKVQYEWNFILKRISNLKKYLEELPKSLHKNNENSKERWLITGGLGGIGWQMAEFIGYNRKVSHLFLLGRRGPNEIQTRAMEKMRDSMNVDIQTVSVDLASKMQMKKFFDKLQISLTGIIHSAGCVHDTLASKQNLSTFRLVTEAKCDGLLILEKLCRPHPIKHFIVNSSISAVIGNRGQCNYSAANAFVDEIMLERRAIGLPATIINWGNWLEIGMAVKANKVLNKMGFIGLETRKAMNYLQIAIDHAPERMIVIQIDVRKILHCRPDLARVFLNGSDTLITRKNIPEKCANQKSQLYRNQSVNDTLKQWSRNPEENGDIHCLKSEIAQTLKEMTGEAITIEDYQRSFMDLGLDSLKIYRFVSELTEKIETKPSLNVLTIFEHPTINQLSHYIGSIFCRMKKNSEKVTTCDNFRSRNEENLENTAKNFKIFLFHTKDEEKLKEEKRRFLDLSSQASRISKISPDQPFSQDQSTDYMHVVWGSKHKILRNKLLGTRIISNIKQSRKPTICFMVSGQGSQVWNMGKQLSCIFPFFREKFDETLDVATRYMPERSVNIRDVIYQWNHRDLLYKTEYAQPIIYCFAYSLAKLYEFCGVKATFFVGHSVGELVACMLAGQISLEDALKLVIRRGEILSHTRGKGKMIAVKKNDVEKFRRYSGMSRAAVNSNKQIVLSGDNRSAGLCLHFARLHQCPITVIEDCYPFHSSAIDETLLDQYRMECRKVKLQKTKRRNVVSSFTGEFMDCKWTKTIASIRSTVLFKRCVETLRKNNTNIWLEIGKGEILTTLVKSMVESTPDTLICPAIRNDKQEVDSFIHSLCQLQIFGVKIKWDRICSRTIMNNVKSYEKKTLKKLITGKETDMELIEQHLIHGRVTLPAAFTIAMFVEFTANSSESCISKQKVERKTREKLPFKRKTITLEALRLEKRVNEIELNKLRIKFVPPEWILTDNISKYSSCRLGNEKRKKIMQQMEQINALKKLRNEYEQLKVSMDKLPHQAFYETMRRNGLQYGPKYQILREIYRKGHYIGAKLTNVDDLIRLLDGALQLLSAALLTTSKSSVYIPFAIDDIIIRYDAKSVCSRFHAYGMISKHTDNIIKGTVIIYEDDKEIIILHNVAAIDISAKKSITTTKTTTKHRNSSDSQYSTKEEIEHPAIKDKNDTIRCNMVNADNIDTAEIKNDQKSLDRSEISQIEIVSYAGQFPGSAVDCASLWNNLKAGTSLHSSGKFNKLQTDVTIFDPIRFGITPKEAAYIDPQQRILLEMAQMTIEKAGLERLDSETGVFIGVSSSDFAQKAYKEIQNTCSYLSTGTNQSVLAGRIAYWLNLRGPAMVVDTACSSFFSALVIACDNIRMGNCQAALVGAVNVILNSKPTSVLENAQMLTKTGCCKVFDVNSDGYVRSEGAAMILIQGTSAKSYNSLAIYRNDMKFTIESYGIEHNGRSNGLTVPSGISQFELINRVSRKSINMSIINWVEAHATGTPLGDPIETNAIARALTDRSNTEQPIRITSVKSSIGHCEAAAGAASLIMALEAYHHRYLPPVQHFKLLNTNIINDTALIVPVIGEELPDTFDMLINSFGFSGTNVSIVLRGCKRRQGEKNEKAPNYLIMKRRLPFGHSPFILVCSGDDSESFKPLSEKLEDYLKTTSNSLVTLCASLQDLRSTGRYRTAMPIKRHTQKWTPFRMSNKPRKWNKVVFSMGRSPEPTMIAELCTLYRSFRKIFMRCAKTYKCANSFASSEPDGQIAFEYISKLSLVTFLLAVGIAPSTIIAPTRIDRTVAQLIRRKCKSKYAFEIANNSNKEMPYQRRNFKIRQKTVLEDFDCILSVQTLRIEKPETVCNNNWKRSFTSHFANTICQLYEHFIDINWRVLNDRTTTACLIPDPEYSKKRYWPFTDCNTENTDYDYPHDEVPFSNLQLEIPQKTEKLDEKSPVVDQFNSDNFGHTKTDSINCQYLYKLVKKKCILPDPKRIDSFIAINLTDTTTAIGQQAIFIGKINDSDDDIAMIQKQIDLHKCTKLVLEWIIDEENLLADTIRQSMLVINLWKILVNKSKNNKNDSYRNTNEKLCLIVFAIISTKGDHRLFAPFSALLKTLAMEQTNVNFKSIHTDIIDQKLFHEISDENFLNEIIHYNDGNRYVERLQQMDSIEPIVHPIRNVGRMLVIGNIRGIAGKLIEVLKPHLAVVVSRTMPNTCHNNKNDSMIRTMQADCTDYKQMKRIFATFAPFDVIFHCAAIISNSLMENMNLKLFGLVCNPKVIGLQNIIRLSRPYPNQKIVAFSSAATVLGSAGQANYVVGNELMEYLMRKDMPEGLLISWGPWDGRGLLAGEHIADIRKQIQNSGWKLLQVEQVAQLCCKLLSSTGHHIAMDIDFDVLRKKRPYLRNFLESIPDGKINIHQCEFIFPNDLHFKSGKNFSETINNCITEVSGITDVKPDLGFMSMGIDSLMVSEMQAMLNERLKLDIPVAVFYEYSTVQTLSQYIAQSITTNCKLQNDTKAKDINDEVAIIGYSGAFSGVPDDQTFWRSLLDGNELIDHRKTINDNGKIIEAVGLVPDIDKFDYRFWNMSPGDASYVDPQIRKFVEHAYVALERSGLVRLRNKLRIAVVAGAEPSEYVAKSRRVGGIEDLYEMNQKDFIAAWTSHLLDLHGPSFGVYSACSTALVAIIQALNLLRTNQCDVALAGAVSLAIPRKGNSDNLQGMVLSSDGHCRPFDHKSSGTVRGSAVGVVILRRLSEAQQTNAPVIVKIAGYGITNDGLLKSSFMAPNISGQRTCIKEAIEMTGEPEVDYIECHGTGTTTGDLIELTAMSQLYHRDTLIGSVKANIGHALAGSGIAAIIKLCKIAEMRIIPKQINFDKLNENLKDVSFRINQCNMKFQKKKLRLAVNASGIGGTNAHIIMENDNHISSCQSGIRKSFCALTISGRTENACVHLCDRVADYLKPEMNLTQVASTLQNYREHFEYRIGVSVKSVMDAINQLKNIGKMQKRIGLKRENVAFYFAPQGLEYPNMGFEAMAYNDVFREVLHKCCSIATRLIGINFESIIHPLQQFDTQHRIVEQQYSQMATFIVSFALAEQLRAWEIEGCIMIGHSLGEYIAAAQAGVFDVETALKILFKRGCLIAKTDRAKMVALSIKSTDEKYLKILKTVEVSAILRSDLKCLVGKPQTIEELKKTLEEDGMNYRELVTSYGFHTSFMDPILDEFAQFLENFTFQKPAKQILSNIDGQIIQHFDSQYMVKHMRSTLRIDKCINNLSDEIKAIIEIGPKGILESLLKDNNPSEIEVISTLPSKKQYEKGYDTGNLLSVVTKLWMKGYEPNWEKVCGNYGFDRFLPNYQFEKDICWEHQEKKWNTERFNVNLYESCWLPYKFANRRRFPKGVLLFLPRIFTRPIDRLLTMLHNLFIPVQCIFSDALSSGNLDVRNDNIYINSNNEKSYQELAKFLRNNDFHYDTIIHAWNFPVNHDTERISHSNLLSSFYSIYWVSANVVQSSTDLKLLVSIDWNAEPELLTVLGPIRELVMTRRSVQCACILCTPEVDLFEALQLLESYTAGFSLIRNSINGEFELFSYKLKPIENDNYITANGDRWLDENGCLVRSADVVVIFGFGIIGQSFINVLCEKLDFLTVCVASPNATRHFRQFQNKINQWETSGKSRKSGKVDITNVSVMNPINDQHTILAYDVDVAKEEELEHFLTQITLQHGRINVIIHAAAGKVNNSRFEKSFDEIQSAFQPKIQGVRNIINTLCKKNISIQSLILNSSMNALFGLPGNTDYAASNIFLDACCGRNFRNIQNITTIQWTGWNDSSMFGYYTNKENKSQNPVKSLVIEYSLSVEEAERMIWKCLHERGLIAVSSVSPNDIVRKIRKLNFTVSHNFATHPEQKLNVERDCNDLRNIIKKIWMDNLGVEKLTRHDDFFQLGGHSLNGMQIIWEINRMLQINCKLDDLFQNSLFEHFLQFLQKLDTKGNEQKHKLESYKILDNIGRLKRIPLSYPQENMYILRQLQHPTLYNISFLLTFRGLVCIKSLQKALISLTARQTSLRTAFSVLNDTCYQEIHSLTESYYNITWPNMDEVERCKLIEDEKNYAMDLSQIPFRILPMCKKESDIDDPEYLIVINQHHIITDGWSMTIFANELGELYRYYLTNQRIPKSLEKLSRNVTHFAVWQRSDEFTKTMQDDLQRLCIKLQRLQATRIVTQKTAIVGSRLISQKTFSIPASLWTQINRTARQYQQTTYTVMLTAFLCLVRKFSDDYSNNAIVIGCPVSGRVDAEEMKSIMGYFLNNIILIVEDFKTNASNNTLFEKVREAIQEARSFEHLPFHLLVANLSHQRRYVNQHPVFDIFFNYRHNLDFPKIEIPDVRSTITQFTTNNAFDFACTIDETDEGTLISIDYNANQYSIQLIDKMITVYFRLLKSLSGQSDGVRNEMNDMGCRINQDMISGSPINIIEQQCMHTDDLTAFCLPHQAVTYRQMYGMIHTLCKKIKQFYLQSNCANIRADTIVPICADSNAIIVPLLAVQLIGAAYAPIDPANSTTVIAELVHDVGASIIVVQGNDFHLDIPTLPFSYCPSIDLAFCDTEGCRTDHLMEKLEIKCIRKSSQSFDISYVIFTSGTTGKPKAVCVTNRNLLNFVLASTQQAFFRLKFRIYHSVNTIFDVSCMNIFTTFTNGGCLISSQSTLNAPVEIVQKNVQFAFLPSALFNMFDDDAINQFQQLEKLYVGGETPSSEQVNRCLQVGIRIGQIYGPTETTVWSLFNNCSVAEYECGRVIGTAIDNETVYLLDPENNIACNGGYGELIICGEGVSRGYFNQEANAFMLNKFHSKEDEMLNHNMFCYRTGDLAMKLGEKYHFLGRKDKQLKVRGYRVEPAAIEIVVRQWDSSIRNVVVLRNDQLDNLILFIEKDTDSGYCEGLRQYLKKHLLYFMIPKKIIVLQRIPLNRNGKIDMNSLKEMMENDYPVDKNSTISGFIQTSEILLKEVRQVWCQLLGVPQIKLKDDFFVIGGHSLLLVLLRQKLRDRFEFELNFEQFYRQPTLAALIDSMCASSNVCNGVTKKKEISNEHVCPDHTTLLSSSLVNSNPTTESVRFMNLREVVSATGNLYMIHAIAGTVYPYFGLVSAIPQCLNIYAIEYEFHYPSNSLMELAFFYSRQIVKHSEMKAIHLMGHSLGGILAREIAELLRDDRDNEVPFVIMLDSWCVGISNLHVNTVKCYLQEKLKGLPGKKEYIKKSEKLTRMLQNHQFSISSVKIYLLKAKNHGNSPLRTNLRGSISEQTRSSISNGWYRISATKVDIFLVDGDHDSMLQQHNIPFWTRIFAYIYATNGVTVEQLE